MKAWRTVLAAALFSGVLGAALGWGGAQLPGKHALTPTTGFMETQRGHLTRLDGASVPGRVVFLGSSTFQGLDISAVTPLGLNLGLGGDTLQGLARRMEHYRSPGQARAVLVNIGLNDLMQRCRQPDISLTQLLSLVPAPTPVIVLGAQHVDAARHGTRCNSNIARLIAELNAQQAQACSARPGCTFLPHPTSLASAPSTAIAQFEDDGIHLSPAGYRDVAELLRTTLAAHAPELAASPPLDR